MCCTSSAFLARMRAHIDEIEEKSEGILSFVEYIPLPHFGNTILRFDINRDNYTLDDLDAYEAFMQDIVHDEFLIDFMGSVYQAVGFEPSMFEEKFRKCYHKYKDTPVIAGDDQANLINDGISLLSQCGLPTDAKVWEIQIEEDIAVFVLGGENRKIGTWNLKNAAIHVYEVEETPCIGLMRAVICAREQNVSLVRVLLEA